MPRLPKLRVRALADLDRQLRFEPARAARRHLIRAEALLSELLEAVAKGGGPATYAETWVVHRITGLRDAPTDADPDSALVADALLGDLAAFIDRLSAAARIGPDELNRIDTSNSSRSGDREPAQNWLSVPDLCARWGVSRKSLERARRRGLASRRVWLGRGRERTVFRETAVRTYERAFGTPQPGDKPRRIPAPERARILAHAGRYHDRLNWSLDKAAKRLAARHGRARETIRQLIASRAPAFERRPRARATVYRSALQARAAFLRELNLDGPAPATFARPDAEGVFLAGPHVREGLGAPGTLSSAEAAVLAAGHHAPDPERERALASAYWYLMHRARTDAAALARARARLGERVDRAETSLRWASRLKAELVREQLPAAVRAAESRLGRSIVAIGAQAAGGVLRALADALIEAVDVFDPFKGGRLAAPAGLAVNRALAAFLRANPGIAEQASAVGARATPKSRGGVSESDRGGDWTGRVNPWQAGLEPAAEVRRRARALDGRERRILESRFGWDGGPPRTAETVAKEIGTTATQVRAAERRALARLGRSGGEA